MLGVWRLVVPADDLMSEASKLTTKLAAGPTKAFGGTKHLLETAYSEALETQLNNESRSIASMMRTHDDPHGIASFLTKTKREHQGE